jgi:hypothetical protein
MSARENHLEAERRALVQRLERDRVELFRAARNLQPELRALDHAEQRVRQAAEALPIIAWGLAELTLAGVAVRYAMKMRRSGWVLLGLQAFRAWKSLRDSTATAQRASLPALFRRIAP